MYMDTPSWAVRASTTTAEHFSQGSFTILKASPRLGKDGRGGASVENASAAGSRPAAVTAMGRNFMIGSYYRSTFFKVQIGRAHV